MSAVADPGDPIDVVARQLLAQLTEDAPDRWEDFPEVGNEDWLLVVIRCLELAPYPPRHEYREAYEALTARARAAELLTGPP